MTVIRALSKCVKCAKYLVLCLLFSQTIFANATSLILISPVDNFISYKEQVLFKGRVQDISSLKLNGKDVVIDSEGKFYFKESLTKPNTYHRFEFKGKDSQGQDVSLSRKVFYKVKTVEYISTSPKKMDASLLIVSP
ncbi:hypothetical protein DID80_04305, partial [Candidatus Marinamargulisbacteria bacterium SCGC AAA071-K20]